MRKGVFGLWLLLVMAIVWGCSSTDAGQENSGQDALDASYGEGAGEDALPPDIGPDLTGIPETLALVLDPEQVNYPLDTSITVTAIGMDAYGNVVEVGPLGPLNIAPPDVAEAKSNGTFKFLTSGEILLSACLVDAPDVCGNRTVLADVDGPTIDVYTPARGAMLSGDQKVLVSGKVWDAHNGVAEVTLNGQTIAVAPDGAFSAPMDSVHGLNLVDVVATDHVGNEGRATRSYLYTTKYLAAGSDDPAAALVDKALLGYLDDSLFYNSTPGATDSLSALFQVVLADLDIGALLPNPVVQDQDLSVLCLWDKYDIFINNIQYGTPDVILSPVTGGITLQITIPNFTGDFAIETDGFACADFSGSVSANALLAQAMIEMTSSPAGDLVVNVTQTEVLFDNLQIKLNGIPGTLLNWLIDLFQGTVANLLQNEFKKQVEEMVSGLTDTLAETLGVPIEIPLDGFVPGNDPVLLKLFVRFSKAVFSESGGDLDTRVSITAPHTNGIENPGSLGRAACLAQDEPFFQFDLANPSPIELAGHFDLLNQALYGLWSNGGLHLHVTSEALAEMGTDVGGYGISDLVLDTAPLLPPVLTSCNEAGELRAQIGDFYLEANMAMFGVPADIHMFLFLELAADLSVVDGEVGPEIALAIDEPNYVIVGIESVNDEWKGKEEMLTGLITETLVPKLLESLQDKPISFALPTINLGGLLGNKDEPAEPGALDGKELAIALTTLTRTLGYVHMQGGIKVQDVPPPVEDEPAE
jgi:hypothetical protein